MLTHAAPASSNGFRGRLARWLSPDPADLAAVDPADPQSWNRNAHVENTPLESADPLGFDCDPNNWGKAIPGAGPCLNGGSQTVGTRPELTSVRTSPWSAAPAAAPSPSATRSPPHTSPSPSAGAGADRLWRPAPGGALSATASAPVRPAGRAQRWRFLRHAAERQPLDDQHLRWRFLARARCRRPPGRPRLFHHPKGPAAGGARVYCVGIMDCWPMKSKGARERSASAWRCARSPAVVRRHCEQPDHICGRRDPAHRRGACSLRHSRAPRRPSGGHDRPAPGMTRFSLR